MSTLQADVIPNSAVAGKDFRGKDRRSRPTPMFSAHTWLGGRRRSGGRRPGEAANAFVDQHGHGVFLVVVAIIALNFLDAWFTTLFLSHGGEELNPLIQQLLDLGTLPFVLCKSVGIGLCVAILTVARNFRFARAGLGIVLIGYGLLLGWHVFLFTHLPD